jgi:hypothetical protein
MTHILLDTNGYIDSTDPLIFLGGDAPSDHVVSQCVHPLVDEVLILMQSSTEPTLLFEGDFPSNHVVSQPIQPVVEEVVVPMKYSVDPTLLLEIVESTKWSHRCNLR